MDQQQNYQELLSKTVVNINGEILPAAKAKISIFDRGFLYGDSIYEVTYSENGFLLFFEEHLDRLFNSAQLLDMHIFLSKTDIINEVLRTCKESQLKQAYIRIIITRGETALTLDPNESFKNNLIIIVKPKPIHPQKYYTNGLELYIPKIIRNDIKSVDPNAKSGNYLNNVLAMSEAKKVGADDALMVNHNNEITEGTTFNIWFIKNNILYTPDLKSGLLKGITRQKVIEICRENNIPYKVTTITREDIEQADEAFITSSTRGIMPVKKINSKIFGETINDWPLTKTISHLYSDKINQNMLLAKFSYL